VIFHQVVNSGRIIETGFTIPQFSGIAPNEHPQERPTDPSASRGNDDRHSQRATIVNPEEPHALQVYLQMLQFKTKKAHLNSHLSNSGDEHLVD
jgi:hypothetical protein